MKFHSPMIIVADIEKSKSFYTGVLNEAISLDLGGYVVMGGFAMMSRDTWREQTKDDLVPEKGAARCFELYFEESMLDDFVAGLQKTDVGVFQALTEAPWGQRTVRLLDPDGHVVEVSEPMEEVVRRLLASGMSPQEASEKTMMPVEFVTECAAGRGKAGL
ncbi:MAG: VOC family protein [Methanomassiliicoccaceae archaeon]|nr:VOC family protein [Methanomassiliicoccaceae archaeon]